MRRLSKAVQLARSGNLGVALQNRRNELRRLYRRPVPGQGNWSVRRINALHAALPAMTRYLEIGLYTGHTFENITIPHRVGVDPDPKFDLKQLPPRVEVYPMTSDEFFSTFSDSFDLSFVDGLHTYRQTYRDTVAAIRLSPRGILLIDDIVPCDRVSAMPDEGESLAMRRDLNMPGNPWHGDVFRMVLCLADYHPELALRTIVDGGNPQLLVWRQLPVDIQPVDDSQLASYESISFDDVFHDGIPEAFQPSSESSALADAVSVLGPNYD